MNYLCISIIAIFISAVKRNLTCCFQGLHSLYYSEQTFKLINIFNQVTALDDPKCFKLNNIIIGYLKKKLYHEWI